MTEWVPVACFEVYGDPKGQPRPRAFRRGDRAAVYDPGTAEGWKASIAIAAQHQIPKEPLDCPLKVRMQFFFKRPLRLLSKKAPDEHIRHIGKPDCDNLEKAVLDALTQIGFFRDDSLVCDLHTEKFYSRKNGRPGMWIEISKEK